MCKKGVTKITLDNTYSSKLPTEVVQAYCTLWPLTFQEGRWYSECCRPFQFSQKVLPGPRRASTIGPNHQRHLSSKIGNLKLTVDRQMEADNQA